MSEFNKEVLLATLMNDEDLAREIVAIFVDSAAELISMAEKGLAVGDFKHAALNFHSLAGAAANVGATGIASEASYGEKSSRESNASQAGKHLQKIDDHFSEFMSTAKEEGWI